MILYTTHRDRRVQAPARWRTVGYRAGRRGGPEPDQPPPVVGLNPHPPAGANLPVRAPNPIDVQGIVNAGLGRAFGDLGTQLARLIPAGEVVLGAGIALTGLLLVLSQTGPGRVAARGVKMGARVAITRRVAK